MDVNRNPACLECDTNWVTSESRGAGKEDDDLPRPALLHVPEPAKIKRTSSEVRTWNVWTGTISDLGKLAKRFEEMATARGLSEKAVLTLGNQTATGSFSALKQEIDPRTWTEIVLRAGQEWDDEYLQIRLRRKPVAFSGYVVELRVRSPDAGATAAAIAQLSAEIELSKPRWSWLHNLKTAGFVVVLTSILAVGLPFSLLVSPHLNYWNATSVVAVVLFGLTSAAWGIGSYKIISRALPPAEIRHDSALASSGSKFVGGLIGLVLIPTLISAIFALVS